MNESEVRLEEMRLEDNLEIIDELRQLIYSQRTRKEIINVFELLIDIIDDYERGLKGDAKNKIDDLINILDCEG